MHKIILRRCRWVILLISWEAVSSYGAGKAVAGEGFFFGDGLDAVLLKSPGRRKAVLTMVFIMNQVALAVNLRAFFMGGTR
jgi:hypothetical protein